MKVLLKAYPVDNNLDKSLILGLINPSTEEIRRAKEEYDEYARGIGDSARDREELL
jgi:hypothetical protein